jgi:hypothetical protein
VNLEIAARDCVMEEDGESSRGMEKRNIKIY